MSGMRVGSIVVGTTEELQRPHRWAYFGNLLKNQTIPRYGPLPPIEFLSIHPPLCLLTRFQRFAADVQWGLNLYVGISQPRIYEIVGISLDFSIVRGNKFPLGMPTHLVLQRH